MSSNRRGVASLVDSTGKTKEIQKGCTSYLITMRGDLVANHFPRLVRSEGSSNKMVHVAMRNGHHVSGLDQFGPGVEVGEFPKYFELGIRAKHCRHALRVSDTEQVSTVLATEGCDREFNGHRDLVGDYFPNQTKDTIVPLGCGLSKARLELGE
jgi:hypothetical protein